MPTDAAQEIQALIDEEEDYDDGHAIPRPTGPPWIALPLATVKELLAEHRKMHAAYALRGNALMQLSPIPRLGPCRLCGSHPDQRHRILDAIVERLIAGEPIDQICGDYEWTPDQVQALYDDVQANLAEMATHHERAT